jgi:hypothetical protein
LTGRRAATRVVSSLSEPARRAKVPAAPQPAFDTLATNCGN